LSLYTIIYAAIAIVAIAKALGVAALSTIAWSTLAWIAGGVLMFQLAVFIIFAAFAVAALWWANS